MECFLFWYTAGSLVLFGILLSMLLNLKKKLNDHIDNHPEARSNDFYGKTVWEAYVRDSWVSWDSFQILCSRLAKVEKEFTVPEPAKPAPPATLVARVAALETKKGKKSK